MRDLRIIQKCACARERESFGCLDGACVCVCIYNRTKLLKIPSLKHRDRGGERKGERGQTVSKRTKSNNILALRVGRDRLKERGGGEDPKFGGIV